VSLIVAEVTRLPALPGHARTILLQLRVPAANQLGAHEVNGFRVSDRTCLYAAARVNKIYGGTSEIMKEIISRSLQRLPHQET
jgi:hypothetical protein